MEKIPRDYYSDCSMQRENMKFGHHLKPIGAIRARDFRLRDPMGGWITESERDEAFRSFQFMGAVSENLAIGCAITKTHHVMSAFAYACSDSQCSARRYGATDDLIAAQPN